MPTYTLYHIVDQTNNLFQVWDYETYQEAEEHMAELKEGSSYIRLTIEVDD
jgi:L-rhamnose mutarotase